MSQRKWVVNRSPNLQMLKGYERGTCSFFSFFVQTNKRICDGPQILLSGGFCNWGANLLESSGNDK